MQKCYLLKYILQGNFNKDNIYENVTLIRINE